MTGGARLQGAGSLRSNAILAGEGEEPAAEDHFVIEVAARKATLFPIQVRFC